MYKVLINYEWIVGTPKAGDKYRFYPNGEGSAYISSVWVEEPKPNKVVVTSHSKRAITSTGVELSITSEIRDGNNVLLSDFNDSFVMPVKRVGGSVEKSLLITFINGVCTRSVTFNQSGEYEVTKEMVNLHLDSELDFDGFNISVYE